MASLLFPDAGSRRAEDTAGRPAVAKTAVVYADAAGATLAEIYADSDGAPGAAVTASALITDAYGFLPLFWGPAAGTDKLYVSVNGGPVWPINADYDTRVDALAVRVVTLEAGGGGEGGDGGAAAVAAHEADTTNVHGVANTAVLETLAGAQAKADLAVAIHNTATTSVHGIPDMGALETKSGAQAKADAAQAAATAAAADRTLSNLTSSTTARINLGLGGAALLDVGTTAGTVTAGDDGRLTDSRTPTVHAASHASAGSDPVTVAQSQVTDLSATLAAKADLVDGKVPSAQIPAIAVTDFLGSAADQAAMLALTGEPGDWTIREDTSTAWVITGVDPSILAGWTELPGAGGGTVTSVNAQTGVVTLAAADVGAPPTSRTITAGTGLTGGGDLTANRTLTVAYGATSTTAARGDDTRLADARTPTAHAASHAPGGSDPLAGLTAANVAAANIDGVAATASLRTLGTGAQQAAAGNDTRIVGTDLTSAARTHTTATKVILANDPAYGTPGTRAAFINALDAAEAAGKHTTVYLPAGFTVDVVQGLSMSGRSAQIHGSGSGITGSTPNCSVIKATAQTGPVLDYTGWVTPNAAFGRIIPLADVHIQGDGIADPTLTHSGIKISSISSVLFRDISVRATGGPCMDLTPVTSGDACYLSDFERITLAPPAGAQANDVPWFRAVEANCNRFRSFGLRGNAATGIVGASGAVVFADGASFSGHDNLFDGWWFEFLHAPTNGTLISHAGNANIWRDIQFVDCGKEAGASGTSYYRLLSPTNVNSGGNWIVGVVPGDDNATGTTGMDTGVRIFQSRNRVSGVRGYRAANVTLEAGTDYNYVELAGSVQGTGGNAVVNNSAATHNIIVDGVADTATYHRYKMTGQTSGVGGPRFEDLATPANGGVWIGSGGGGVQAVSGSFYYSVPTAGTHIFRSGTASPNLSINTSGAAAAVATSPSVAHPDVQYGTGFATRFGAAGPVERFGTGTPEGVVTAPVGSRFVRTDGGTSTTLYVKESGSGNTGWVAVGASGGGAPAAHAASHAPAGSDALSGLTSASFAAASVDGVAGTAGLRTLGMGAQQAAAGNDPRLHDGDVLTVGEFAPPRRLSTSSAVGPVTSGTLALSYWTADKTETIATVTTYTGGTAAGATPTLCRVGIYSVAVGGNLTLVASIPSDTALWATTFTTYARALTASFSKVAGTRYACGLLVVSGAAIPTFHGAQFGGTAIMSTLCGIEPAITSSLTGQSDLPASITAGTLTAARVGVLFRLS